jgi:hypothetical protein
MSGPLWTGCMQPRWKAREWRCMMLPTLSSEYKVGWSARCCLKWFLRLINSSSINFWWGMVFLARMCLDDSTPKSVLLLKQMKRHGSIWAHLVDESLLCH